MGNVSSVREGEGEGRQQERGGQGFHSPSQGGSEDLMGQSPPQSPRRAARSPLLFTPQSFFFGWLPVMRFFFGWLPEMIYRRSYLLGTFCPFPFRRRSLINELMTPMVPLQRFEEMHSACDSWMQSITEFENAFYDQGIPTMITWSHGGKEVFVEGSWDNWKTKKPLQKSGKDFTIMKVLPSGFYQYKFIVDGEWRYAPDIPWMRDDLGNAYNILDLKEFVPEDLESIAGFEPPQSPDSSYNNWPLGSEDFAKEPPSVPPQLQLTLLNAQADMDSPSSLSRPPHVVLNHLYIQKGKGGQPIVALGATRRFLSKYVTVVLYKSLQR